MHYSEAITRRANVRASWSKIFANCVQKYPGYTDKMTDVCMNTGGLENGSVVCGEPAVWVIKASAYTKELWTACQSCLERRGLEKFTIVQLPAVSIPGKSENKPKRIAKKTILEHEFGSGSRSMDENKELNYRTIIAEAAFGDFVVPDEYVLCEEIVPSILPEDADTAWVVPRETLGTNANSIALVRKCSSNKIGYLLMARSQLEDEGISGCNTLWCVPIENVLCTLNTDEDDIENEDDSEDEDDLPF